MPRLWACLKNKEIVRGDCSLRAVQDEDIEKIRLWRNLQISVLRQPYPITREQQEKYYLETIFPSMLENQPSNILVSLYQKDKLIGYGGIVHLGWEDRRGEISFLLNPEFTEDKLVYQEKHIIFLNLVADLAFLDLGLNKIFTETWSVRRDHIDNLEAFGFRQEGTLKAHVMIDGKYEDALMHGMLASEYNQKGNL